MRVGRILEQFDLVWIEEPLDAYDARGPRAAGRALDTSIATGEMLSSVGEHVALIEHKSVDIIQPDAPADRRHHPVPQARRAGRSRPVCSWRRTSRWRSTCTWRPRYPREPWVEHFDWLNPLFNERLETRGRPDDRAEPARPRLHPVRPGRRLDRGHRGVRSATLTRS